MNEETINGDPYYTNLVTINWLNRLGWSRKRKRKWLRRSGMYCNRARVQALDILEGSDPDVCWCGVKNPYFAPVAGGCGGTGSVNCYCGGDQCVCHNHGEIECPGCWDCEGFDDGQDDDDNGDW